MASPHIGQPILAAGKSLDEANAAMILVHGRGATAESILGLATELHHDGLTYLAPQAAGNTWYPYRFIEPIERNEPYLSSALELLGQVVKHIEESGIPAERIILGGFSQGACLAAEFVARNPRKYGGLLVYSGGLIGPLEMTFEYEGSLDGTPVFIGCSDVDFHIPKERVETTAAVLNAMGAQVDARLYAGMGHTINDDELNASRDLITKSLG